MVDVLPSLPQKPMGADGSPQGCEPELEAPHARIDQLAADAEGKSPCLPTLDRPLPWLPVSPEIDAAFENMVGAVLEDSSCARKKRRRAGANRPSAKVISIADRKPVE